MKRKVLVVLIVMMALVLVTPSAFAILRTINTDDTLLDANWQATPYLDPDPEESLTTTLPADMDIQSAWLASDATSIYFRIQVYNEGTAFTGAIREAWAQMDCDGNNSVNDAADRWIIYEYHNDTSSGAPNVVYIRSGASGLPLTLYNDTYGERPTAAADDDNIEWKVDLANLPSACRSNIQVQYHTDNQTDEQDDTTVLGVPFGVPTAINLQSISASQDSQMMLTAALIAAVLLGSVMIYVVRRRQA